MTRVVKGISQSGSAGSLAATLGIGNDTGNYSIKSPDGSSVLVIANGVFSLIYNGVGTADFANRVLKDEYGQVTVNWADSYKSLYYDNLNPSVYWAGGFLYDYNNVTSVDWNLSRILVTDIGSQSVNWNVDYLYSRTTGAGTVNWDEGYLYDRDTNYIHLAWMAMNTYDINQIISIDWDSRLLRDHNGWSGLSLDWDNRNLYTSSDIPSVQWDAFLLLDDSYSVKIDWKHSLLYDNSVSSSVDWENRKLFNTAGVMILDWENGGVITNKHNIQSLLITDTVYLSANSRNIINPAGTLATSTIVLPYGPRNDDIVVIKFCQAITVITMIGGTLAYPITTANQGDMITLVFDAGTNKWY